MVLIIGIVLTVVGLVYLCWLLFTLAVYALPVFVGASVAFAAYDSGAGPIAACMLGLVGSGMTLVTAQFVIARVRSPFLRAAVAVILPVPAALAGYYATLGLAQLGIPAHVWQHVVAMIGAIAVGATAWARFTLIAPPNAERDSQLAFVACLTSASADS
jgi:hypothetical protein